ncbi:helix-turn-helix domain-containing protein [bacterium]|nr:helix-turn-helix domain-containing protein [bacterium]MCI0611374.1 helix-turn-helix domain-containing protein [bacterium]
MRKKQNFSVKDGDLLSPLEAGRVLGIGSDGIRYLERVGQLRAIRTAGGNRLFFRHDLENLRRLRQLGTENQEVGK